MTAYTTRDEAIYREIIEPLSAGPYPGTEADLMFDIEAIADEVLGGHEVGYAVVVSEKEFWTSVAWHALADDLEVIDE